MEKPPAIKDTFPYIVLTPREGKPLWIRYDSPILEAFRQGSAYTVLQLATQETISILETAAVLREKIREAYQHSRAMIQFLPPTATPTTAESPHREAGHDLLPKRDTIKDAPANETEATSDAPAPAPTGNRGGNKRS